MAKKATLVCRPCGYGVTITDLGSAVVECYECGMELQPAKAPGKPAAKKPARKALPARKTAAGKKAAAGKTARKPAAKKASKKK